MKKKRHEQKKKDNRRTGNCTRVRVNGEALPGSRNEIPAGRPINTHSDETH
ncbi:hypothetical protein WN55_09709 [Dufourea novaeangliae]|uniref:Uncharacterized protein n=1 Tax=Dufourea novaeangliae TaxID=178035 RepID=A0A154P198_DUFNO|nr:hypothetical protein WN55_09709 [Dufourea novaeangliae]